MIEIQVFVPTADNDGVRFTEVEHATFEEVALRYFGGVTLLQETVMGLWAQEGKTYRDVMRVYVVGILSIVHADNLGKLAEFAKAHYRQEALYVRYLGISEIL